ncbi:hypothetical protein Ae406Ps2_5848c [Pseudonocardia sp. Ae406_Ps2]|nr:hypothetical protein Ae331Ps2_0110 [Pseudonocardia sp. Ae331_Ps2]OLM05848.1 hypothetical protein Ae406Ps2_5848c [Pseudonocardia sp. Ae406_Ps2]
MPGPEPASDRRDGRSTAPSRRARVARACSRPTPAVVARGPVSVITRPPTTPTL